MIRRRPFDPHRAVAAAAFALAVGAPASAADAAADTLEAVVRALGFLESGPRDGQLALAVVYADGQETAAADAGRRLDAAAGPRRSRIRATTYSVGDVARTTDRIDAALLLPGAASEAAEVAEFIRQRRVVSLSSDAACLAAGACVLMVSADRNVEIILDTRLADLVGAEFSAVFKMMVKRQ